MSRLTNKEAAILSELVYTKAFFEERVDATKLRGQTLYDIFFENGVVSQTIVSSNPDIAMHLSNNYDHYAEVLNKYQLVETTSTIVDGGGAPIEYKLLGENSYSGIVLTEISNPTNTVFVSRGTATKIDGIQDFAAGAGFTPAYMQDAHKFYHDVLEQQKYPEYRGANLGVAKDNISTAGHSLGGTAAEAIALAALANGANVNTAQTFEGYGVDQLLSSPVSFVDDIFSSLADTTISIADVRSHLETLSNLDISQISDVSVIGQSIKDAVSSALTNLDNLISSTPDTVLENSTKLIALNSDIQALFDSDVAEINDAFNDSFDTGVYSSYNQQLLVNEYFKQGLNSLEKQISEADNDISEVPETETLELLQKHKDKYELVKELEQAKLDYPNNISDQISEFESALDAYYGENPDLQT